MRKKSNKQKRKNVNDTHIKQEIIPNKDMLDYIVLFLEFFMCKTVVKTLLCILSILFGLSVADTATITGFSQKTVRKIKKNITSGNKVSLFSKKGRGRKAKLVDIEQEIVKKIESDNYHTRQQIADMIEDVYGIKVSLQTITRFLKKHKIKRLKCGSLPAKADPVEQRTFYDTDTTLSPLIEKAKKGDIVLLSVDASHFVMGCDFLGHVYGKERRFVKTFSGRKRYNVLGALNLVTKAITTVTNDTYITATQVCELFEKVCDEYLGIPVYLILDNARYQKCKIVQELADKLCINLVYIPPYSPNLNMIERIWKHVKAKLRSKYYDNFTEFSDTIDSLLKFDNDKDRKAIDRLIGEIGEKVQCLIF
jgi:transposase